MPLEAKRLADRVSYWGLLGLTGTWSKPRRPSFSELHLHEVVMDQQPVYCMDYPRGALEWCRVVTGIQTQESVPQQALLLESHIECVRGSLT